VTWRADASGARFFVSPNIERVLGVTPAQVSAGGASFWLDRVHPEDRAHVRDAYAALFAARAAYDVDCRVRHAAGHWVWLSERACLVDGGDGLPCADGVSTDVTARKETEAALREAKAAAETASRLKSEFLATVSHELRTPLTAILGFGQLLARGGDAAPSPRQRGHVERILGSAEHLLRLIDDLLDLAKIEAGRLEVELVATDIRPVLAEVGAEFDSLARAKGLALCLDLPAVLPPALADPTRLRQILRNLVDNAVKFTDRGRVAIETRPDGDRLAIAVADTGVGIAPRALAVVFDEFRQIDGSATRAHGGIGLGLPIARKLARLLGGTIDIASQLGVGSTFTLRLLRADGPSPTGAADPEGAA
jgi:PAS domain S-box-containing protein